MPRSSELSPAPFAHDSRSEHNNSEPEDSEEQSQHSEGSEESQDSGQSDADPSEWLATGRQRREGAGNRYSQLLLLEQQTTAEGQQDDDLALLFEENNEEDVEFEAPAKKEGSEDEDDDDDSSTDEEDKGPAADANDFEGEEQLQKEERANQRASKRKAAVALTRPIGRRKRVKIDDKVQSTSTAKEDATDRPRKKSERVSWVPTAADAPVRASSRTLSVRSKQKTLESMKENESKRLRTLAAIGAAQKRRDVEERVLTQAERLAEAAETERLNSKSLSKWEEMESDRAEKQRAKLAALRNRTLKGPVVRWYSGRAEWVGDDLVRVGKESIGKAARTEPTEKKKRKMDKQAQASQIITEEAHDTVHKSVDENQNTTRINAEEADDVSPMVADISNAPDIPANQILENTAEDHHANEAQTPDQSSAVPPMSNFIDGLHYYASLPPDNQKVEFSEDLPVRGPPAEKDKNSLHLPQSAHKPDISEPPADETHNAEHEPPTVEATDTTMPAASHSPKQTSASARNLITLLNFDEAAIDEKDIQRRILFSWPAPPPGATLTTTSGRKTQPPSVYNPLKVVQPVCVITGLPAKYQDPLTGLPYANMEAFKTLRRLAEGGDNGGVWSGLLQAWVGGGETTRPAKGVPEGFLRAIGDAQRLKVEGDS